MATKTWIGGIGTIGYDSGGTTEPTAGHVISGQTSGAIGIFVSATETGGTWGGGDAAGVLTFRAITGTFLEDDILDNDTLGTTNIATIDIAGTAFVDSSGDFDIADNWSASGIPATADNVFFNGLATTVPAGWAGSSDQTIGKKFSVNDGFDQSAKDFASIVVSVDYNGNIGQGLVAAVHKGLRCACDAVTFAGSGDFHLIAQHASLLIDSVSNSSASGTLYLGKGSTNGRAITNVINSGATIVVLTAQASTLAAPEVINVTSVTRRGTVTIPEDNSSSVLHIIVAIGTVTAYCDIANAEIVGGTVNWGVSDFAPASAKTIDLLQLLAGSFKWDMAGTISECYCHAGKFTLSGSGVKVLGDSSLNAGAIEIYNAEVDFSGASNNISLAADAEVKRLGDGIFIPPKFTDIVFTN